MVYFAPLYLFLLCCTASMALSADELIMPGGVLEVHPPENIPVDMEALVASMSPSSFGDRTLRHLEEFVNNPEAIALIFKKTPLGDVPQGPVNSSSLAKWGSATKFFGNLVGYEELESKSLFKDIFTGSNPNEGSYVGNYTAGESSRVFGWHVENLAHPCMPRYVLMLCLRQDTERITETLFLPGQTVVEKLSVQSLAVLQQKRFLLTVEDTLDLDNIGEIPEPIPLLRAHEGGAWQINLDSTFIKPAKENDTEAQAALKELIDVAESSFQSIKLESGDLIIWDNTRTAHDRQFSGSSRWLQRTHAYTGFMSPFEAFQYAAPEFLKKGDPNVVQTAGAFQKLLGDKAEL